MAEQDYANGYGGQGYGGTTAPNPTYPTPTYPYQAQTYANYQTQPAPIQTPTQATYSQPANQFTYSSPAYAAGGNIPPSAPPATPQTRTPPADAAAPDAEALKKANKQAESSLTWGIVGLLFCMFSIAGGWFACIIAFLIDAIAIDYAEKAKKAGSTSKKATVGKILGWISIVLGCFIIAAFRASNNA